MEPRRVLRPIPVVAGSHPFEEEQDSDLNISESSIRIWIRFKGKTKLDLIGEL
jgi:hypothetical protein